jgi:TRAP-type C4-dicarboxylate transport system substrate-binding protein
LFSKKPLLTIADVKSAKLFTSQGDDRMVQWYKSNGFRPVAIPAGDIPAQLKLPNGLIDAAPSPPYPALLLQMFRDAKYMLDVRVAPLYGALVVSNEAWNKIDAKDRPAVIAAAQTLEKRLLGEAPKLDTDSLATMKTRGLTVNTLDAKATAAFRAESEKLVTTLRGNIVPADLYDMALREREAFRKTKK